MTDGIQEAFVARCAELVRAAEKAVQNRDAWDNYLGLGAGEQVIAGDHEERHLLELLQNARDAIFRGRLEDSNGPGRVFIAVTEHGMAMANSGSPFRLDTEEVLRAVRLLQRSEKTGQGFIGHKGVGLKSILLRAGAFAVRTRIEGELLRATFSRWRTADHLLRYLDEHADLVSEEERRYFRQQLPRLPMFTQPHADAADGKELGPDRGLVEALLEKTEGRELGLDGGGEPTAVPAYRTVVYLPYEDERWERLLASTEEELGQGELEGFQEARRHSYMDAGRANAEETWKELVELDHRVLVLLGEIEEIQYARFEDGDVREVYRMDIEDPLLPLSENEGSGLCQVRLRVQRWTRDGGSHGAKEERFVVLSTRTALGTVYRESPDERTPASTSASC